ncbi:MAG: transcription initiation factor IIB, partial [Nitrosopumilus sp.]|nr:transcription initiation factor IIB [Nitrosopumilus sp.]
MVTTNQNFLCLRCGKNSLLTDDATGERFCSKCGFVISETLQDSGPEWRSFSKDGGTDPTRT